MLVDLIYGRKKMSVKPVDLGEACRMAGANRQCGIDSRWKHCATGFCNRTGWCEAGPRRFDQLEYSEGTCVNGIKVKPNFGKFYYDSCNFTRNNRCGKGHGNTICNSGYCDYYGYCTKSSSADAKKWQQKEFAASTCKPSLVKPVDLGSPCRMAGANRRCGDEFRDKHCNTGFCNRTGWCGSAPRRDDQLAYGGGTCINGIKVKPVLRKVKKSSCKLESNGRCGKGHGNLICRRGYCDYYGYCSQSSVAKKWQQKEFSASASTGACRASLVNLVSKHYTRCMRYNPPSVCYRRYGKQVSEVNLWDYNLCRNNAPKFICDSTAKRLGIKHSEVNLAAKNKVHKYYTECLKAHSKWYCGARYGKQASSYDN